MLDPLKTIIHCSFRKKTLPLLWCGRQASHKPVLALGPSAEKQVLQVGALDVLLSEQFWLICYKGATDKNGLWKTIPAVSAGGNPQSALKTEKMCYKGDVSLKNDQCQTAKGPLVHFHRSALITQRRCQRQHGGALQTALHIVLEPAPIKGQKTPDGLLFLAAHPQRCIWAAVKASKTSLISLHNQEEKEEKDGRKLALLWNSRDLKIKRELGFPWPLMGERRWQAQHHKSTDQNYSWAADWSLGCRRLTPAPLNQHNWLQNHAPQTVAIIRQPRVSVGPLRTVTGAAAPSADLLEFWIRSCVRERSEFGLCQ